MLPKTADLQPAVRVLAAIVNFGVAAASIIYLRIESRALRWSRSSKSFVTRDESPGIYWFKMSFAIFVALFTIAIGVLLLLNWKIAPGH